MKFEQQEAWRKIAALRGLRPNSATSWERARSGPRVLLEVVPIAPDALGVAVTVRNSGAAANMLDGWVVMPVAHCLRLDLRLVTGDANFDQAVAVFAPSDLCVGLFDAVMRQELAELVRCGVVISQSAVRIAATDTARIPTSELATLLDRCERLFARLQADETTLRERVLSLSASEPSETVRAILLGLIKRDPGLREVEAKRRIAAARRDPDAGIEALTDVIADTSIPISERRDALVALLDSHPLATVAALLAQHERLLGAIANEARGAGIVPVIHALGRGLERASADAQAHLAEVLVRRFWPYRPPGEPLALRLLLGLLAKAPRATMFELLGDVFPGSDDATFEVALELVVGASPDPQTALATLGGEVVQRAHTSLPRVVRKLGRGGDVLVACFADVRRDLKIAYLDALAELGDTRYERFLESLVDEDHLPLQCAAIRALGECGTMKSLETLEPLTGGLFRAQELKQLAKAAIARIEARFAHVKPGGLTLAEAEGGLSFAATDAGRAESENARNSNNSKSDRSDRKR
jgi:hypothetical protein